MTVIRSAYDDPVRVGLDTGEATPVKQSFKEACDINGIVARFEQQGIVPEYREGRYLDVSSGGSYRDALHTVMTAQRMFDGLPSGVRARFSNDVAEFVDFVSDEGNLEEMNDLGLDLIDASGEVIKAPEPAGVPSAPASEPDQGEAAVE